MAIWQLAAFAVFFACCGAQFWFVARVRNALIDRHSAVFLEIERSSIFPRRAVGKFIRSGRHNDLGDAELSKAVIQCRWVIFVGFCAWLVFAAGMFVQARMV